MLLNFFFFRSTCICCILQHDCGDMILHRLSKHMEMLRKIKKTCLRIHTPPLHSHSSPSSIEPKILDCEKYKKQLEMVFVSLFLCFQPSNLNLIFFFSHSIQPENDTAHITTAWASACSFHSWFHTWKLLQVSFITTAYDLFSFLVLGFYILRS